MTEPSAKILMLMGPTAVGKSSLAIALADRLDAEIISADSMLVYRGMDIGTAKPSSDELQLVPHHMINICDVCEDYDVASYVDAVSAILQDLQQRGKMAIICGGTNYYLSALSEGLFLGPKANWDVRDRLRQEIEQVGAEVLYQRLQKLDPPSAQKIHSNDHKRLLRALEVYELTGKPLSEVQQNTQSVLEEYSVLRIGLKRDREVLNARIEQRTKKMFELGLVEEVRRLQGQGLKQSRTASVAVGYKQVLEFLELDADQQNLEALQESIALSTRQLVKKQLTWLKRDSRINWICLDEYSRDEHALKHILSLCKTWDQSCL